MIGAFTGGHRMQQRELRIKLEEHHRDAFGWALSCCEWDRTMTEDVLHSSYLKVLDGRAVFSGRSSFKTWLFAVIRRTASEQRRRQMLRRFLPLTLLTGQKDFGMADAESDLLRSESSARLVAALKVLPPRQRELLHLVFYQNLTIRAAAEVLGVSLGTARTHYERGKERLRDLLAAEYTK